MTIDKTGKIILVVGATGQQGGATLRHLRSQGWTVRAFTRDPQKPAAQALTASGVEVVAGELDDRASLDRALHGIYGVFSVQTWKGTEQGIEDQIRHGKALADAASAARIQHLVHSSVGGAERGSGIPHFENQFVVEQYIHSLKLPATVLRPVFFMENFFMFFGQSIGQGSIMMDMRPDTLLQMIAVDDIGSLAALAFDQPDQFIGKTIEIAGDELTLPEVAETLTRVLGREIRYMDNAQMWQGDDFMSREFSTMFQWYNAHGYAADLPAVRQIHPQTTTFENWLYKTRFGATASALKSY